MRSRKFAATGLAVCLACMLAGSASAFSAAKPEDITGKIDKYIASEMNTSGIPGLALGIVKDGETIYLKGFGRADDTGRPVTPKTPFIIASVSKSITAMAVMQLAEAGKVDLDKPVTTYLPYFETANKEASDRITVRHLLNQTSGFTTYTGNLINAENGVKGLFQTVWELRSARLATPSGAAYHYSNANYIVLAAIVESVSGELYDEYLQNHIFRPLQMPSSYVKYPSMASEEAAAGYQPWFGIQAQAGLRNLVPYLNNTSTAEDMTHYLSALMNGGAYDGQTVCSADAIIQMQKPAAKMNGEYAYGMGWEINNAQTLIKHPGDSTGYNANIAILPNEGYGIILMENTNWLGMQGEDNPIITGIESILTGKEPATPITSPLYMYIFFDAIYLVTIALLLRSFLTLGRWRKKTGKDAIQRLKRRFIPIAILNLAVPVGMLINIPIAFAATWELGYLHAPDFCIMMWAIALSLFTLGITRTIFIARRMAELKRPV